MVYRSSLYPSLRAAITAWMAGGGTLVVDTDHIEILPFQTSDGVFLPGKQYRLETDGPRTVTYNGPNHYYFLRLYSNGGADISICGELTIDCQDKVGIGLWIDCSGVTGSARRALRISGGLKVKNVFMRTDPALNILGASCIKLSGGFASVHLDDVHAENSGRANGAGAAGSYGCNGIEIFGNGGNTANPLSVLVENWSVTNVYSQGDPTDPAYEDMDGLLIFQFQNGSDIVRAPIIRDGLAIECTGRAVKRFAPGMGGLTENIHVIRSKRGKASGSGDIAHQDGSGVIRNIEIHYSGDAHASPTTPIGLSLGTQKDNGGAVVENIRISDTTGVVLNTLIGLQYFQTDNVTRHWTIRNLRHDGSAKTLFLSATGGRYADCFVTIEDVDVALTTAVAQTDDPLSYLKVNARNFVNRSGTDVPVVCLLNGTQRAIAWGDWVGDASLRGFKRYVPVWRGHAGFSNGFRGAGGGCIEAPPYGTSEVFGRTPLGRIAVANGATCELPPFGSDQSQGGDYSVRFQRNDASTSPPFTIAAVAGGVGLALQTGAVPGGWDVRSTGAPSGAGSNIEIWKDSATQALRITNNSAVVAVIDVTFNP